MSRHECLTEPKFRIDRLFDNFLSSVKIFIDVTCLDNATNIYRSHLFGQCHNFGPSRNDVSLSLHGISEAIMPSMTAISLLYLGVRMSKGFSVGNYFIVVFPTPKLNMLIMTYYDYPWQSY